MTVVARDTALIFVHPRPLRLHKHFHGVIHLLHCKTRHYMSSCREEGRGWPVPATAPFGTAMRDRSFLGGSWARTISEILKCVCLCFLCIVILGWWWKLFSCVTGFGFKEESVENGCLGLLAPNVLRENEGTEHCGGCVRSHA